MKKGKNVWMAGVLCTLPLMAPAQQTRTLTDGKRLFDDGKELFLRQDYAAAQQTLLRYVEVGDQTTLLEEADYMLACTASSLPG
jgi:TolA-binding protein